MGKVPAGRLNRRVRIERKGVARDDIGQPYDIWLPVAEVWANVRMQRGSEFLAGGTEVSVGQGSVRIRRRSGIDAGMRLVISGEPYDIKAVLPDEEGHEYMDLAVGVGGNAG